MSDMHMGNDAREHLRAACRLRLCSTCARTLLNRWHAILGTAISTRPPTLCEAVFTGIQVGPAVLVHSRGANAVARSLLIPRFAQRAPSGGRPSPRRGLAGTSGEAALHAHPSSSSLDAYFSPSPRGTFVQERPGPSWDAMLRLGGSRPLLYVICISAVLSCGGRPAGGT